MELENIVVKWVRADIEWSSPTGTRPPRRRLVRGNITHCVTTLVEGRWLLSSDALDQGDLDSKAPGMDASVLVPALDGYEVVCMDVFTDRASATLEFDLAVELDHWEGDVPTSGKVFIWRIVVVENQGRLTPTATCTTSSHVPPGLIYDTSLFESKVAHLFNARIVEVYDWKTSHRKSTVQLQSANFFLQLLPDRKVLVCDANYVRIYNVPESSTLAVDDTPQTSPADAPVFTLSVADVEIIRGGLSALYFGQSSSSYISFATEGGIYVLTLDADDLVLVTRLAEHKAGSQSCYGLAHRAYVRHCYNPHASFTLNLLKGQDHSAKAHDWEDQNHGVDLLIVDEWTGRVVDSTDNGSITVLDFVR